MMCHWMMDSTMHTGGGGEALTQGIIICRLKGVGINDDGFLGWNATFHLPLVL